ncbi:hypothetical protein STRTUCAR8_00052, partial [Streptomyces turgidiscabies Car8]
MALLTGQWSRPHRDRRHGPIRTATDLYADLPKGLPMSDSELSAQFLDAAIELLRRVRDEETDAVTAAGTLIADTVAAEGRLFAFGAGHSSLAAQDIVYRAGGLALMNLL